MIDVISADGKCVAITAENEDVQIRTRKRNATRKRQRAAMKIMNAMRLDKIWKPAGATNARDGRDFFVQHFALFNQFEIKREHRKIAATRTPGRMIGSDFFFRQTFTFGFRQGCR